MATHSGGSLIQGVEAYQCSWVNANGDLLTLILNVATDDARFAQIRPGDAVRDNREAVDVADQGWLAVTPDEVKLKAVKGRTVIDVELMEAARRVSQLISPSWVKRWPPRRRERCLTLPQGARMQLPAPARLPGGDRRLLLLAPG